MSVTDITTRAAPTRDGEREPPHDLDAEQVTLGAAILNSRALREIAEIITPLDLYRPAHQIILQTLLDMADNNQPLGTVALNAELTQRGEITRVGGAPYLHTLTEAVPTVANGGYYAHIVADTAAQRRLVAAGMRIAQLGHDGASQIEELYEQASTTLAHVDAPTGASSVDTERLGEDVDFVDRLAQPLDDSAMIPTPYVDLTDATTGGFNNGELVCVAGRTGAGKSVVGLDIARRAAIGQGLPVLYASLEMPRDLLRERVFAAEAKVALQAIKNHALTDDDWQSIATVWPRIAQAPLFLATPARGTLALIRQRLQTLQRRGQPARVLVVDHVGLMAPAGRVENRYAEISAYSRGLKQLAMEFNIPVVMLCQVNRAAGHRADAIPRINDLRDSGSLEQDSDIVLMVHREDYDVTTKEAARSGEVDLYLAKNRSGPTAVITVAAQLHYARFVDMARG